MICFWPWYFYLLQLYSQWFLIYSIFVYLIFSCHLFYRFLSTSCILSGRLFCLVVSYDIGVELFVVLFSIFVVFEVEVYFIIIFISTLHLRYDITLHWYNFYYFNQHRQDNKPINLSTNKTNQSTNLSVLVIFLAKLYLLNRTNHNKIKPNLNYKTNFR